MKTRWIVILIILLVLICAVVVTIMLLSTPQTPAKNIPTTNPFADTQAPTESLSDFISTCFKTYVQNYIAKDNASTDSPQLNQYAASCFTQDFIQQWPSIAQNSDSDPVLLSQDFYPSWETDASAAITSQTTNSAVAIVNLGTGSQSIQLIATLQMTSDGWRISKVTSPQAVTGD